MKYKLINSQTKEESLCDKITIGIYDYYVSDEKAKHNDWCYYTKDSESHINYQRGEYLNAKKVIATNNPNIDIPKVVDEVEILAHRYFSDERFKWEQENPDGMKSPESLIKHYDKTFAPIYKAGYNKSQEEYPFSEEDMIEFAWWLKENLGQFSCDRTAHFKGKYFKIWKEQQPKSIWYE